MLSFSKPWGSQPLDAWTGFVAVAGSPAHVEPPETARLSIAINPMRFVISPYAKCFRFKSVP